jgi:UDP-2-acetamido-2-deoxy-ribo-hexuluronate aminotransferase
MQFCDLSAQYNKYKDEIKFAMDSVLESATFINGPAVKILGDELSAYAGVKHALPSAKPLGCYGDGGAIFTNDDELAEKVRLYTNHGQEKRYYHKVIGINGRMDSLQAAIVSVNLKHFDSEIEERNRIAASYTEKLKDLVKTPQILPHNRSTWAQYTIQSTKRDAVREYLNGKGIPTAVHYPLPLPRQEAFAYLNQPIDFPVSEKLSNSVISLPMHPFLSAEDIDKVCNAIAGAVND